MTLQAYQNRNRMMREWAANQTRDAYYIDFDVLARAPNLPAACASFNKHYGCHLRSLYGGEEPGVNYFREPHLQVGPAQYCFADLSQRTAIGMAVLLQVGVRSAAFNAAEQSRRLPVAARRCSNQLACRFRCRWAIFSAAKTGSASTT